MFVHGEKKEAGAGGGGGGGEGDADSGVTAYRRISGRMRWEGGGVGVEMRVILDPI